MRLFVIAAFAAAILCVSARAAPRSSPRRLPVSSIAAEAEVAATPEKVWRDLITDRTLVEFSAHLFRRRVASPARRPRRRLLVRTLGQRPVGRAHARRPGDGARRRADADAPSAVSGPLQEMGVSGVLTFTVAPHPNGAKVTMTYRVTGDTSLNLNTIAAPVDNVLMEQFGRLTSL